MGNKKPSSHDLAVFFAKNCEKENLIATIFDYFDLDCLNRCKISHAQFDSLIKQFNEQEECNVDIIATMIDIIKTGLARASDKEHELIKQIIAYIEEHLTEEISVEAIAEKLHISYYYMCHLFKKKYGITVSTFRNHKRLENAIRKLTQTEEKIGDIASLCGFNNISYFTEMFTKIIGLSPSAFRAKHKNMHLHPFYELPDILLAAKLKSISLMDKKIKDLNLCAAPQLIQNPNEQSIFLHEAAIIEYHGVLYASWYSSPEKELRGFTPICGKRSYDGGKSWTDLEIICQDKSEKIIYCPPVYGIFEDQLYLLVNQMVAPDHIHSLDLYRLNPQTDRFEFVWSKPIPFKLNTNVIALSNGKCMLPGRVGELDGFPNTPAVLISDSGKIDTDWRLVKIAPNGDLPDGSELRHPEISVMESDGTLYMFCRNDKRAVPLVYLSADMGESWSKVCSLDIPFVSSKMYAGNLKDGKKYLIANIDHQDRSRLAIYWMEKDEKQFNKKAILFDQQTTDIKNATTCHYPCAYEYNEKLYIIATLSYKEPYRSAAVFTVDLNQTM